MKYVFLLSVFLQEIIIKEFPYMGGGQGQGKPLPAEKLLIFPSPHLEKLPTQQNSSPKFFYFSSPSPTPPPPSTKHHKSLPLTKDCQVITQEKQHFQLQSLLCSFEKGSNRQNHYSGYLLLLKKFPASKISNDGKLDFIGFP